ncbi:MAG TPA: S9 family peptidase [Thermoanaerobaculia bacterium]|nr:S9 family peptidase [Thermoanaerobaculia bacterium]
MLALLLAATLTVDDYVTMPTPSTPRLAPDGKRVAYVLTRADMTRGVYDSDVWLADADGAHDTQLTRSPGSDNMPKWSPDGRMLAFLSDRDGRAAVWTLDLGGGEPRRLNADSTGVRDFEWSPDGKRIAFVMPDPAPPEDRDAPHVAGEGTRQSHLYVADVATRAVRRLTNGPFTVAHLSWSPDGARIAIDKLPGFGLDDYYRADLAVVNVADGAMTPLVTRPGLDATPRWSPDGRSIAFVSQGGVSDWLVEQRLYVVPAAGGEPRVAPIDYDRTPDDYGWMGGRLWINGPWKTTTRVILSPAEGEGSAPSGAGRDRYGSFGGFAPQDDTGILTDADVRGNRAAFVYQTVDAPPEVFIADVDRFAMRRLTHHNDELRTRTLGATRLIKWKNPKDGLEIEGLLTLPVGYKEGTKVPLLTFVHGGPASRFDQGFLGYLGHVYAPQVLAARGFAILRPNPRGTGGYGPAFRAANRNDWGGMDWLDINAGIDEVIRLGVADPDRLGLMGWSYGGFIASSSIGKTERFEAISIGAPVVDLMSFHGTTDIRDFIPSYFRGLPPDLLRERSPLWHLRKIQAPVLIQHGEADERVPTSQGVMLYRRLQELGVDVTLVTYPRTPHVPREPRLRLDVARRNVAFFSRVLLRE